MSAIRVAKYRKGKVRMYVVRVGGNPVVVKVVKDGDMGGGYRKYLFWVNGMYVTSKILSGKRELKRAIKEVAKEYGPLSTELVNIKTIK